MAEMISTEDIANVKNDLGKIAETLNTEAVITPRYGNAFNSIPLTVRLLSENGMFKPFETEAELLAYVPEVAPTAAKALDTKKVWIWKQTSGEGIEPKVFEWISTGLSEVDQAKEFTQDQITKIGFRRGINIFNKINVEIGKYYNYLNGQKGDAAPSFSAILIEVEGNTEYRGSAPWGQQFAFLTNEKVYISGQASAGTTRKFTTPEDAKYIALTVESEIIENFMLCKSNEFPAIYTPYIEGKNAFLINTEQVNDLFKNIKQELGFTYINIVDPTNVIANHYVDYLSGQVGSVNGFYAAGPYEIKPNTEYQTSSAYNQQGGFYDKHGDFISGFAPLTAPHKFTTPANAKYLKLTIPNAQLNTLVVAESTLFPSNYVPHTAKIIDELIVDDVKTNEIWVSADINDNSVEFKGKNAIQLALDSITDANAKNRYVIRVKKGLYKITQANQFIGYPGYPAMILMKEHVDIVGQGKDNTIIWAELPYDDAAIGASANGNVLPRSSYQTVYDYADDAIMKDLTLVAKNLRYTVHIDNPNGIDKTHKYKDVDFIFKGDKGNLISLGIGTHSGEETYIEGGTSHSDTHIPFACHNNIAFGKPSLWSFKGHTFSSINSKYAIYMQSDGSLLQDKLNLEGCSFAGSAYLLEYVQVWLTGDTSLNRDTFNHAEWLITGYGNEPFLFSNLVEGYCLRIKSNTTGVSTSIRFDKNSSAYPILIKNNQSNTDTSLYINSREFIDGYIVQDGSVGLAAQAWGCKDLAESIYLYDNGVNFTSMGKRLGDCSTVSKVLVVIVNGVTNSITFNKDYTAMSNVQILTEINAQLSGATADLYIYGRDYFPILSDVSEVVYNTGVSYIPKGSVVTKSKGTVKLANGNDKVYGVALDDIPVMITTSEGVKKGEGRVLKRGYIYANQGRTHFVLSDNQNPPLGTRFSVNNGQLVTDVNGKISVDIDEGVVSINC